jgi:hypothetical protein
MLNYRQKAPANFCNQILDRSAEARSSKNEGLIKGLMKETNQLTQSIDGSSVEEDKSLIVNALFPYEQHNVTINNSQQSIDAELSINFNQPSFKRSSRLCVGQSSLESKRTTELALSGGKRSPNCPSKILK